jgi:hypothetical protein
MRNLYPSLTSNFKLPLGAMLSRLSVALLLPQDDVGRESM